MNIVRTALLLIITLVLVPVFSYYFRTPLNTLSVTALNTVTMIMAVAIAYSFVIEFPCYFNMASIRSN